jgi:two-component system C4-dicarboxylate transport sensor histidine kinase DctB
MKKKSTESALFRRGRWSRLWIWPLCLLVAVALVWLASSWFYQEALDKLIVTSRSRLALYDSTFREALSRYSFLPYVVAQDHYVQQLLEVGEGSGRVNLALEKLNREAGSEAFYVMDAQGNTLASSNWRDQQTYLSENYRFRPYFIDTQQGRAGRFFAIGATTGQPGYFFSQPVYAGNRNVGAAVVKVELAPLQDDWHEDGEIVLVSDANGVVFLSNSEDLNYKTMSPLTAAQHELISAGKQYGHQQLSTLSLVTIETLGDDQAIVQLNGTRYLMLSCSLTGLDLIMYQLVSLAPVTGQVHLVAVNAAILVLLVLALGLYGRERKQKMASRRRIREAEAIHEMNVRLQDEIDERKRTEKALRETQEELLQAGKLVSLGHMAAGIVHELNQPIAAIRTYVASGKLLVERKQLEPLDGVFGSIKKSTEYMASITAQLKTFACKAPKELEPINVQESLTEVITMTAALLKKNAVELQVEISTKPMLIRCYSGRIKQVLLNLIHNAVDAMQQPGPRLLTINIRDKGQVVEISVADNGSGIADHVANELFTPFVTTKAVGAGLGIGLSICNRIVDDIGGTIRAENRPSGGARFIVTLPLTTEPGEKQDDR